MFSKVVVIKNRKIKNAIADSRFKIFKPLQGRYNNSSFKSNQFPTIEEFVLHIIQHRTTQRNPRKDILYTCICIYVCATCCCAKSLSHIWLFVTLWTVAHQAPLFVGFSRHEYWSGLPCPSRVYMSASIWFTRECCGEGLYEKTSIFWKFKMIRFSLCIEYK